ncbi:MULTISPECIES: type II toxin-antitoxin system HicB family antitoxin [unclassified Janthinobacterium]|uniref:type II toxin-antitoxin system HicB family antitoxin n=1 Tax=unclassified Janthinobacterium TaxID=2610881 RepID=UPI0016099D81|nr:MULTISPECIES: type II toxin-antitoxin system HicB family antitoxin [unclassified Janthinobacterium]MBB5607725.1 putative RNase H-like HicB family nuclease [Janthinobacterium sp. S3T4]MBB5613126.1 putative RNase H-like HicB family nuclease [Janthinobacterium sp. S3M3]
MLYPLYVWKDANSAYGAAFPDLPGVNTAADDLHDLNKAAQEAVETMYEGEANIPAASDIGKWMSDPDYADGFWMLVEIDLSKVNTKPVRLNISLPESLLRDIDRYAKSRHLTRSGFLAQAAMKAMAE